MGRLQLLAIECNYEEACRQLKEQFIHGLKDAEMLGKINKKLTKIHENEDITSENMLSCVKRVKVQRAQSTIMNSPTEVKEFNKLKVVGSTHKEIPRKYTDKNACKANMQML